MASHLSPVLVLLAAFTGSALPLHAQDPTPPAPPAPSVQDPAPPGMPAGPTTEEDRAARRFLAKVMDLYHLPWREKIRSREVRMAPRDTDIPLLKQALDAMDITYTWTGPEEEKIEVKGVFERFSRGVKQPLQKVWKDLVAGGVFAEATGRKLRLEEGEKETHLVLFQDGRPVGRYVLDRKTHLMRRCEYGPAAAGVVLMPSYKKIGGKWALTGRSLATKGSGAAATTLVSYTYGAHKKFNGQLFPTRLAMNSQLGQLALDLTYTRLNGHHPAREVVDPAKVKALVQAWNKNYAKWGVDPKRKALKELEETRDPLAAKAIIKKMLKDRDPALRKDAVAALGAMGCREAVSPLIAAFRRNQKNIDVYIEIATALGKLGDPKAVKSLAKDLWSTQRGQVRAAAAKIDALGKIRSRKAVDALIGLTTVARPWQVATVAANLRASLKKLTGQDFGLDARAWKRWWKGAKGSFKLEED